MMDECETLLLAPPGDGISCLDFSPRSNLLLLSSWDSTARLYDTDANRPQATFDFSAAVLSCCLQDDDVGYACGLDNNIHRLNIARGSTQSIGCHNAAVSCLAWSSHHGALYSGSWDSTVGMWDARSSSVGGAGKIEIPMPGKVYSIAVTPTRLVVATADRHVMVYDVRYLSTPEQKRESPLRYQTRKIACFPNGSGFAIGSVEGRVGVEYFDLQGQEVSAGGQSNYAFKCHRRGDLAYPVSAIAFHPLYGTFATGGGDGTVNVWDGENKKRLSQLHPYPTSIASLAFSRDGSRLAIASSYTFEEGEKQVAPDDNVILRHVADVDVKPRPKA